MNKLYLMIIVVCTGERLQAWTWLYSNSPTPSSSKAHNDHTSWLWTQDRSQPFSQLIFSWNAMRPEQGSFTFSVQVRDSKTKQWYPWHKMAQWGKDLQRSFVSRADGGTKYFHVRLELPKGHLADAFKIGVKAHDGASLQDVEKVYVNIINHKRFGSEIANSRIAGLPSVFIDHVPKKSQMTVDHPRFDVLCSPTSTSILLSYLLNEDIDPKDTAHGAYDHGLKAWGSWPFNVAHAFERADGKFSFYVARLDSFKVIHDHLIRSLPVIVSVRGPLKGSATPYRSGHLLVVVGYDRTTKKVHCHDPAFPLESKTHVTYDLDEFLKAWERSRRLAYIAKRK